MYFTVKPNEDCQSFVVDGKTFYCKNEEKRIKRRSNQYKDPLFIAKNTYKELNMIEQFKTKYNDLDSLIERYLNCIETCIYVLQKDYGIQAKVIFENFDLVNLGLKPEDFGVENYKNNYDD